VIGGFVDADNSVEWGLGRTQQTPMVSPVPSIHSVRWVFPITLEVPVFYSGRPNPSHDVWAAVRAFPATRMCPGVM